MFARKVRRGRLMSLPLRYAKVLFNLCHFWNLSSPNLPSMSQNGVVTKASRYLIPHYYPRLTPLHLYVELVVADGGDAPPTGAELALRYEVAEHGVEELFVDDEGWGGSGGRRGG